MTEHLSVLLGMHHPDYATDLGRIFERKGYDVTSASTIDEMLERMGIQESTSETYVSAFHVYVMDANLGNRGVNNLDPALQIYRHIEKEMNEGKVKFLTITATDELIDKAQRAGLTCVSKRNIFDYIRKNF